MFWQIDPIFIANERSLRCCDLGSQILNDINVYSLPGL